MSSPQIQEIQILEIADINQPNNPSQPFLQARVHRGRRWFVCNRCLNDLPTTYCIRGLGLLALMVIGSGAYIIGNNIASDNCDSTERGIGYYQECWSNPKFRTGAFTEFAGFACMFLSALCLYANASG